MDGTISPVPHHDAPESPPPHHHREDCPHSAYQPHMQNLFVMRHGDRIDDFDPNWLFTASRPWDPPLTEMGKMRAWRTGKRLRVEGWNVTRVVCSPFLRCVQTAAEVIQALCSLDSTIDAESSRGAIIDSSKVKVSIEYGLAEVMNRIAIRVGNLPSEGPSTIEISELHALLPAGTVDSSVQPIYQKLPHWQETIEAAHTRYVNIFQAIADKFPGENILCVTHGEGVGVSISWLQNATVLGVNYCAFSHAQRPVYSFSCEAVKAGKLELLTEPEQSGIFFITSDQ